MEKDLYFLKLENEYMNARSNYPTIRDISNYVYERKEMSKEFIKSLNDLGFFKNNVITELDKGCLDSIFNTYDNKDNKILVEISDYCVTFTNTDINTIHGHLHLRNNKDISILGIDRNKDLDMCLDTVLKEGDLDISKFTLYNMMYYNDIDLFVSVFGNNNDRNKNKNIQDLLFLKDKVKSLSNIDLCIYTNYSNDMYQSVLYNPKKLIKKVDK